MQHFQQRRIVLGLLLGLVAGAFLLLGRPATISRAQSPCGPGKIDMLDYMIPDNPSKGNRMSDGECFYSYIDTGGHFYLVKSCSNGIWFEEYAYDDNWIYILADTTWTDQCPDGSYASAIYTGNAGEPGARRYPRCVTDPGAGSTSSIAPASGCVSGLSKETCEPCNTTHSGCYTFDQTLTHNADGTVTINVGDESYSYSDVYGWIGFTGPTGDAERVGDSNPVEADPALLECIGPPEPPEICYEEFPEKKACCPIVAKGGAPDWILALLDLLGIDDLIDFLIENGVVSFTLWAEGPLDRAEQLPKDADYFWASFEERYDSRRIVLPDEEPEDNGMWGGVAMRLAPPDYRPLAMWAPHREERLMWKIPLEQYEVDPWWGDGGKEGERSRPAHHPLQMGAEDAWCWLINTPDLKDIPGLEEEACRSGSGFASAPEAGDSFSGETESTLGVSDTPQEAVPPKTTYGNSAPPLLTLPKNGSSSFQTLGVQLANAEEEVCAFISVSCTASNWKATCQVSGNCAKDHPCVHIHIESVPKVVYGGECFLGGGRCLAGAGGTCPNKLSSVYSIPTGSDSWSITFEVFGDVRDQCSASATCTIDLDANGSGSCTASAGEPCGGVVPPGADICNPPYPSDDKDVCSDVGPRELKARSALELILGQFINGSIKLYPEFTYLERISYRLAGIWNDMFKDYKEEGIGGVFNAFLPPGWKGEASLPAPNEYPTLDAPFDLKMLLKVTITAPCIPPLQEKYECCPKGGGACREVGSCAECDPATENCKSYCCIGSLCAESFSFSDDIELEPEDGILRIRYLGSQTYGLGPNADKTGVQDWLMPPQ